MEAHSNGVDGLADIYEVMLYEMAKVDKTTKDIKGGVISRDSKGNPTGCFREDAMVLMDKIIPEYSVEQYKEGILLYQEEILSYGTTAYMEAIVNYDEAGNALKAYQELDKEGKLLTRVYAAYEIDDAGVVTNVASDYSVTWPPRPLDAIQTGVTRMDLEGDKATLLGPDQRVSVLQMMKAATFNGAYSYFGEKEFGSIEEGKSADYIILDKNIMTIDPTEITKTEVLKTVLKGVVAFQMGDGE